MAQSDDDKLRDVRERFLEKLRAAGFLFSAGVNANRSSMDEAVRAKLEQLRAMPPIRRGAGPTIDCAGCGKTLTPAELAGVTPFGPLCAECNAGLTDGR